MTDLKFVTVETFVIQTVILLLVLYVLNRFVFKPYLAYLDAWEEKQKKLEEDFKNIDGLIKNAEVQKEEILTNARKTGENIVSESENIWKKKREEIIAKAESDAKDIVDNGTITIEKERLAAMNSVKGHLVDLVLRLNGKLFKETNISKDFIEKELSNIK